MNLADHIDRFATEVLADALRHADAASWERRASAFDAAAPRAGDYPGQASADDVRARGLRLAAKAEACRNAARMALFGGDRRD